MSEIGDRVLPIACAALPVTALAAAGVCLLRIDTFALIMTAVTAWAFASVPIGVLVGHCVFTGD